MAKDRSDHESGPDVRESMAEIGRSLPPLYWVVQAFLTWLTGKPLPVQRPLFPRKNAWVSLVGILSTLFGSAVVSAMAIRHGGAALLAIPFAMLLTTSAARTLFLSHMHACAHGVFSRFDAANRWVVEIVSLLIFTVPYRIFVDAHCRKHHGPDFTNPRGDGDATFLRAVIGIRPGMTPAKNFTKFCKSLSAPAVHFAFLRGRLQANLCTPRRALAVTIYFVALSGIAATVGLLTLLIAWIIPLTLLYNISALIEFAGEHLWMVERSPGELKKTWFYRATAARFLGVPYPTAGFAQRSLWWGRMLLIYVPFRLFVLVGDLPCHDFHHARPRSDWLNALYARRDAVAAGMSLIETWGIRQPIRRLLEALAAMPPAEMHDRLDPDLLATM